MRLHDAYARLTPLELAFPDAGEASSLFGRIREEAEAGGVDLTDLQSFMMLGSVVGTLRELRAPDMGGEAIHRYAILLQQAYLFQEAGAPVHLLTTAAARYLVDGAPAGEPKLPAEAGYLQLPLHLFWVSAGSETPESVDGLFWSRGADGMLRLLLALGMRANRPGLAVAPVAEAPWADAATWLDADVRGDGTDFATTLPGGEFDGLYSLESAGEALKLLARTFALLEAAPDALVPETAPEEVEDGAPPATRLPFDRIVLQHDA